MTVLQGSQTNQSSPEMAAHPQVARAEYTLRNSPIHHWPFPHTLIRPILPDDYYNAMVSAYPDDDAFTPLNDYYPDRGAVFLTPDREGGTDDLARLDDRQRAFWEDFVHAFGGDRFRRVLLESLGGPELAESHLSRTRSLIHLSLDRVGYQIQPHTDIAAKIVTALFYLPDEDDLSAEKFGTSVLVEREGRERLDVRDWERYDTAFTAPFLSNTLFAFKVGDASWHGVHPIDQSVRRRSIQFFVILNDYTN